MPTSRPVRHALLFSDVHLGWAVCARHHSRWLRQLPEAIDDAELVVLNGDVIDTHRGAPGAAEAELVQELAELASGWRREGRRVVYIEGNHDAQQRASRAAQPLRPDRWLYDFETARGERVRVLHGHRFSASAWLWPRYEAAGRRVLALENRAHSRISALRSLYRLGPGWLVSGIGALECALARRELPARLAPLVQPDGAVEVLVHGHLHYGPGRGWVGDVPTWRTGSWVSPGHLGTVDRMLRFRDGRFERIGWSGGRWRAFDDGR